MEKARRILRVVLAAATGAVCLLLCWQVLDLYRLGNLPENFSAPGVRIQPVFSRELVGDRLAAAAPFLAVYVVLAAAALVLEAAAPPRKRRPSIAPEDTLTVLRARTAETPPEADRERRLRRRVWLAAGGVVGICVLFAAGYLLRRDNFTSMDLEAVMGRMLLHVAPWAAAGLAAGCAASVYAGRSVRREIAILKAAPKRQEPPAPAKRSAVPALRITLYAAAAALIVLGVGNGGLWDVLVKAVNICTECIGLG